MKSLHHARLIDQNSGSSFKIPRSHHSVVGLSVADKVVINPGQGDDSGMVIVLFEFETKVEGHWLIPNSDLPTAINGSSVSCPMLLSQRTLIAVGDRYLEYKYPIPRADLESKEARPPPPKPRRSSCEETPSPNLEQISIGSTDSANEDIMSSIENELTKSQAIDVRERLGCTPRGGLDDDFLSQINSRDQLSSLVSSLVTQQAVLCTEMDLTSNQVDILFKSFQTDTSATHETVYRTFLSDFKALSDDLASIGSSGVKTSGNGKPNEEKPLQCELHEPVIVLLTEMLRITPFPMDHVILWLTLLRTFSHFLENINVFIREKTAAVVMGCMCAHGSDPSVQQQSCGILAQLALYIPVIDEKGPIRESGVELIVKAMKDHASDLFVLRPASCALANLTMTYANFTNKMLDNLANENDQEESGVLRAMMILDFIRERALPIATEAHKKFPSDGIIHTETRKVIAFFTELLPSNNKLGEEPDVDSYNIKNVRKPDATPPAETEHPEKKTSIQITIGGDSSSEDEEKELGQSQTHKISQSSPNTGRRVQFAEEMVDCCWYDASVSSDGKCARWLGIETEGDGSMNMKSLYDELLEAEQAEKDLDGDQNLEAKQDAVAQKLGVAGVVKGYFKKLKKQISSKDSDKQEPEENESSEEFKDFKPVLEYGNTTEHDQHGSASDTSSVHSDPLGSEPDISSSQEWTQIESGIYCKVDRSDSLPSNVIKPVLEDRRASSGYIPRYRKRGEYGGSLQDLRTHTTQVEKRLYPKGILKNSNLNLNLETQSEGGDSDFEACVRANQDCRDTLDDLDAPVLVAQSNGIEVVITGPESASGSNDVIGDEIDSASVFSGNDEDNVSVLSDASVASDIGDVIERHGKSEFDDAPGVTNLKKKFSKSEPSLNENIDVPKRRKSSFVADKVKQYMDIIKDASVTSNRRLSLPGKSKKYDLQKQFQSKFGNDEFLTKPNFHTRLGSEDTSCASISSKPLPSDDADIKHRHENRGWSVTSSEEGIDGLGGEITLTVVDTQIPSRMSKRHSIAVTPSTKNTKNELEFPPLLCPPKSSPAKKKGVAGALKSYAQRFQRRKSESALTIKDDVNALNENNNNAIKPKKVSRMRRISSAHSLGPFFKPCHESLLATRSTPDLTQDKDNDYDVEDVIDKGKTAAILLRRLKAVQHFTSLMDHDKELTITNLARITKVAMASAGLTCPENDDFGLSGSDSTLALHFAEVCVRRKVSSDCALRMLQAYTEQLQKTVSAYKQQKICEILFLLYNQHSEDGWGFFTLRKLLSITTELVRNPFHHDQNQSYVHQLHSALEDV